MPISEFSTFDVDDVGSASFRNVTAGLLLLFFLYHLRALAEHPEELEDTPDVPPRHRLVFPVILKQGK
ncbi:basic proline-rich protein-like [Iris pallida]|uniref:Basic proline-rich protein-like n=1 Tax=Iris pallida TaxID=29817 RepID=A0AAX6I2B7_IRIPA|nr:basic proline-rich protein-like [Iris pallida]